MGTIIHSKISGEEVLYKILLEEEELGNLNGHLKRIHLFSSDLCSNNSKICQKGNNGVTKYFKIPVGLRSRKKPFGSLTYQKIETPSKVFYLYITNKKSDSSD